ncbi:type B diterpene cyclase [Actinocorallia lasiicapitis]
MAHQRADGSWGGTVDFAHDRCLSTLAAVLALGATGTPTSAEAEAIARGLGYLKSALGRIDADGGDTAGFELVFPTLLDQARERGFDLPYEGFAWLYERRDQKLGLLALLGGELGHAVYNLEAFDRLPDSVLDGTVRSADGGFGCSPAATAAVAAATSDAGSLAYLDDQLAARGDGAVGTVRPFQVFERAWILADLQRAGYRSAAMDRIVEDLAADWTAEGVGMASHGIPRDGDCTALAFTVLRAAGHPASVGALEHFRREKGYVTYPMERDPSVSCNVHVLAALRNDPVADPEAISLALEFLRSSQRVDGSWCDKWHISPYYTTGHAVEAVHGLDEDLCGRAVGWLLRTQAPHGGWGVAGGSGEETAYALTALLHVEEHLDEQGRAAIDAGAEYLRGWLDRDDHPELWVGKSLYAPLDVIQGLILATLLRCVRRAESRSAVR